MSINQQTSKEYFGSLQIIYFGLIAGPVLFGAVLLIINQLIPPNFAVNLIKDVLVYIVPFVAIGGILGSNLVFKSRLKLLKSCVSLNEKTADYRSALIVRYALLEGPSFFALVIYFLTGDVLFLGVAGLIVAVFLTIRPTMERAASDLDLNLNDKQAIKDPNMVISEIKTER